MTRSFPFDHLRPVTLDDALACAETARRLSCEDSEAAYAIAWTAINRARAGGLYLRQKRRPHPVCGDGSLGAASRLLLREREQAERAWNPHPPAPLGAATAPTPFGAPSFLSALKAVLDALTRDVEDPTGGATLLHHHLEEPDWARGVSAQAFAGAYFFYREPPKSRPRIPDAA